MQKFFLFFVIFLVLCASHISASTFTMVRSDNGDNEFLSSPSLINLSTLRAVFNARIDTVIMVHGFNNSPSSAEQAYRQAVDVLQSQIGDRNYVGFYWPADMLVNFSEAVKHANEAGPYLMHIVSNITQWYGSNRCQIHLMGHSLGCRALLSTLQQDVTHSGKWGHCFLMASAVHNNVYFTSFAGMNLIPEQTWAYHSKGDWVLKYLYALYYWLFDREFMARISGYEEWDKLPLNEKLEYMHNLDLEAQKGNMPVTELDLLLYGAVQRSEKDAMGLIGADLGNPANIIKVENVETTDFVSGHTYWSNVEVMKRIAAVLKDA